MFLAGEYIKLSSISCSKLSTILTSNQITNSNQSILASSSDIINIDIKKLLN